MKKKYILAALAALALVTSAGLTSCVSDDDGWNPAPPYGWNTFYDNRLYGTWELYQADGRYVSGYEVNYMQFNGNGRGYYYYYDHGYGEYERMAYYCQVSGNGTSRYQINIQYEYGSPTTMSYWFASGNLWMQWMTDTGRTVTYVYRPVADVPW